MILGAVCLLSPWPRECSSSQAILHPTLLLLLLLFLLLVVGVVPGCLIVGGGTGVWGGAGALHWDRKEEEVEVVEEE